jgi:hypothetical protein
MRIFHQGRSYVWIFFVWAEFFVGAGVLGGNLRIAIASMPLVIGLMLAGEIVSGVALDSWWRATYSKGCWQYTALVAWHTLAFVLFLVFASIDLHALDNLNAE